MPRTNALAEFAKLSAKLLIQHKKHLSIIANSSAKVVEIESIFAKCGFTLASDKPTARGKIRAKKPRGGIRKRGTFKETAEQFVLALLKDKNLTTAELNAAWKMAGRGGSANNLLTKLFKSKTIKRQKAKDGKGSVYSLANQIAMVSRTTPN